MPITTMSRVIQIKGWGKLDLDGIESARATITKWYEEKANQALASESAREGELTRSGVGNKTTRQWLSKNWYHHHLLGS